MDAMAPFRVKIVRGNCPWLFLATTSVFFSGSPVSFLFDHQKIAGNMSNHGESTGVALLRWKAFDHHHHHHQLDSAPSFQRIRSIPRCHRPSVFLAETPNAGAISCRVSEK